MTSSLDGWTGGSHILPQPNAHVQGLIHQAEILGAKLALTAEVHVVSGINDSSVSVMRTELDSHANMTVLGKFATIINDTRKNVDVNTFTPDYEALSKMPVVDACVGYDCPTTGETCILLFCNLISSLRSLMK